MYVQLLSRPLKGLCLAATQKLFPVSTGCCDATYYKTQLEQELLTIPEHPRSYTVFSGVRVTRSLVLCVMYCISLFVPLYFSFGHCVVYISSLYGFWLPFWYLQTLLLIHWEALNIPDIICSSFSVIVIVRHINMTVEE
jgi:hypothetical protein